MELTDKHDKQKNLILSHRGERILSCLKTIYLISNTNKKVTRGAILRTLKQCWLPDFLIALLRTEGYIKDITDGDVSIDKQTYKWVYNGAPTNMSAHNLDTLLDNLGKEDEVKPKLVKMKSNEKQESAPKKLKRGVYSEEELQYIKDNMDDMSEIDIAAHLNRSVKGVNAKKWKIRHNYNEKTGAFKNENNGNSKEGDENYRGQFNPKDFPAPIQYAKELKGNDVKVKNPLDHAELSNAGHISKTEKPKMYKRKWSNTDIDYLSKTMCDDVADVARKLARTEQAIHSARHAYLSGKLRKSDKRTSSKDMKKPWYKRIFSWIPRIKFEKR